MEQKESTYKPKANTKMKVPCCQTPENCLITSIQSPVFKWTLRLRALFVERYLT